jgi:hypothetical protein
LHKFLSKDKDKLPELSDRLRKRFPGDAYNRVRMELDPTGTLAKPSMKGLDYIEKLLQLIEKEDIPAPGPIEQRWTACSKSSMFPVSSSEEDDVFSWVNNLSMSNSSFLFSVCLICAATATCHHLPKSSFTTHTSLLYNLLQKSNILQFDGALYSLLIVSAKYSGRTSSLAVLLPSTPTNTRGNLFFSVDGSTKLFYCMYLLSFSCF